MFIASVADQNLLGKYRGEQPRGCAGVCVCVCMQGTPVGRCPFGLPGRGELSFLLGSFPDESLFTEVVCFVCRGLCDIVPVFITL